MIENTKISYKLFIKEDLQKRSPIITQLAHYLLKIKVIKLKYGLLTWMVGVA